MNDEAASFLERGFIVSPEPLKLENMQTLALYWGVPPDVLPGESDDVAAERIRKAVIQIIRGRSAEALENARKD